MGHIVADRVKETTTTTGTGNITLAGAAAGHRAFSAVMANTDTTLYCIAHQSAAEWEVGLGTWQTGGILARTTVLASSNAGAAVALSAGTKDVFITSPAQAMLWGVLTPAQITANQNDYNPTGLQYASVLRLDADQIRIITGLAGGWDGRIIRVVNVGGSDSTLVFRRQNTGSAAANRFALARDVSLDPGEQVVFQYDGTSQRWRTHASPVATGAVMRMTPSLVTDFLGPAGAGTMEAHLPLDVAVISSGTQSKIANEASHNGILRFTSSTTTNSGGYCRTDAAALLIQGGEVAEFVFRIITLTTSTFRLGLIDTATSADCVDGAYIEIPATGAAVGKTSSNSTRTTSATIATLSINTWYRARIEVDDAAANVTFTIFDANGNQLGQVTNSANIPTGAGRDTGFGYVATNSGTTAVALIEMDYMSLEHTEALIR